MNKNIKSLVPYFVPIIVFLVVTFLFFNPLFQGKSLKQNDIKHHRGMSKEIVDYREANNGEEPLWTNSMFGGMPAFQISVKYSSSLVKYIDKYIFRLGLPTAASFFFLYLIGFYILLLVLRVNPWIALGGALAFGFSSYFIIILEAGHNTKAHAIGYMAPLIASIILTFRKKYLLGGALTALFMALQLNANHPQITYYTAIIVLIYGIVEFVNAIKNNEVPHFAKTAGILIIAVGIAFTSNISRYWSTLEYSPYTIRGKSELSFDKENKSNGLDRDYATQWSYGKGESFSLLIPNIKGGETAAIQEHNKEALKKASPQFRQNIAGMNSYWGNQPFTSGPVYIGAIVFFLAVLAMFIVKGRLKWALLFVILLSLFLSWGKNMMWFTNIFMDYFPAYNKFRAVSMILVNVQFAMAVLAFIGLKKIYDNPGILKEKRKEFYISLGLTAGLSLLFYLIPDVFFKFVSKQEVAQLNQLQLQYPQQAAQYQQLFNELEEVRKSILKSDAIRSFAFIIMGAALVFAFDLRKLNKYAFAGIIAALITIDLAVIDSRYLNEDNYERKRKNSQAYYPTPADKQIMQDPDISYRVFNQTVNTFNDASTSYFHQSIGGYHGAKFRRYQDIIDYHLSKGNMDVFNMLNTKYFISPGQNNQPIPRQNPSALGNAWFVNKVDWVDSPDMEIIHLTTVLEIKNIGNNPGFEVYGRKLRDTDTIMQSSTIKLKPNPQSEKSKKIDLNKYNFMPSQTYVLGNNPNDSSNNFIDISGEKWASYSNEKQFEVRVIHTFEPQNEAVINIKFDDVISMENVNYDPSASINLTSYKPNHLVYKTKASANQLAVFSEIYYPNGWKAYVDGKEVDYAQANYVLRAMNIPAGEHKVEFIFKPKSYYVGTTINLISSIVLLILVGGILFIEIRKGLKPKSENEDV